MLLTTSFVISFTYNILQFNDIVYPRDKSWELSKTYTLLNIENNYEYKQCFPEFPLDQFNDKQDNHNKILTLNLAYIPHPSDKKQYTKFLNQENYKLLFNKAHFNNLKSYQYEGFTIEERTYIDQIKLNISIYQK